MIFDAEIKRNFWIHQPHTHTHSVAQTQNEEKENEAEWGFYGRN